MNPATGTFITQDTYPGTIFDPTSLHKYLYANANPVMNVDPSGYSYSLSETLTAQSCMNILDVGLAAGAAFALAYFQHFKQSNIIDVIGEILDISGYVERFLTENLTFEIIRIIDGVKDYILSNVKVKVEDFKVGAVFTINGRIYADVNPTARIDIQIGSITLSTPRGTTAINRLLPSSHAEIGVMHQALKAGEIGGIGKLIVAGKMICPYCRIDIKKLAIALQLDELIVYDITGCYKFDGTKNEFNNVSSGGKSWSKAKVN